MASSKYVVTDYTNIFATCKIFVKVKVFNEKTFDLFSETFKTYFFPALTKELLLPKANTDPSMDLNCCS